MDISNKLRTTTAIVTLGTILCGCLGTDGRESDEDDRAITLAATAAVASTISGALSSAKSLRDLLGANGTTPQIVTISDQSLDEIRTIVTEVETAAAYASYKNSLSALVNDIRTISTTLCDLEEPGCVTELSNDSQTLTSFASTVNGLWSSFTSSQELHAGQRLIHFPQSMFLAGLRTKLLQEKAELDIARGFDGEASRETLCEQAELHAKKLEEIEANDYAKFIDDSFTPVYSKVVDMQHLPSAGGVRIWAIGCFEGPRESNEDEMQEWCADSGAFDRYRVDCVSGSNQDCGNYTNDRGDRILDQTRPHPAAMGMREGEVDRFYAQARGAVLGGEEFDGLIDTLRNLSLCVDPPPQPEPEPEPEPAPESEPACGADQLEFSNGPYPGQTSGIYERTGTYNGEPVYTKGKFSIYKRNSKYAADNWVLDQDAVDEEWSGTLTHTENKPSTPWEGTWKVGTAVCK